MTATPPPLNAATEQDSAPEAVLPPPGDQAGRVDAEALQANAPDWETQYTTLNNQLLRLAADFDNYRKRAFNEQQQVKRQAVFQTVSGLLPVLDNLDRARASLSATSDATLLYQSFEMLATQLTDALVGLGIERIATVGQAFDPTLHEALNQTPSDDYAEGVICQEYQAGFQLQGQVLKPARVVVSSGSISAPASAPDAPVNPAAADAKTESSGLKIKANPFAKSGSASDTTPPS
jgi:molecular chaperone GrpE